VSFALIPLALIYAAVGVDISPDAMSPVVFDLSDIFMPTPPCAFLFCTRLKNSHKVFMSIPEVEPFAVEHIISIVAVVVFAAGEDLKSQSISSPTFELTVVYVSVYPNSLMA
jgi:hypothetical protein